MFACLVCFAFDFGTASICDRWKFRWKILFSVMFIVAQYFSSVKPPITPSGGSVSLKLRTCFSPWKLTWSACHHCATHRTNWYIPVMCWKIFLLTGSNQGAEDLAPFAQVGQRATWTFRHLSLASSITCIATVRGKDCKENKTKQNTHNYSQSACSEIKLVCFRY